MRRYWRELLLVGLGVAAAGLLWALGPIAQPGDYHAFADGRAGMGIPNVLNVLSNLPFLLVGVLGLRLGRENLVAPLCWRVFFLAVAGVALGSAWYHWQPADPTLVWDRLPMALGFMALFSALLVECLGLGREGPLLALLSTLGLASIAYWHFLGDVRPYVWVQFYPLLGILLLIGLYRWRAGERSLLGWGLLLYALAKVAEHYDQGLYALSGGLVSGHSLKHVMAALSLCCLYLMLRRRVASAAAARAPASLAG